MSVNPRYEGRPLVRILELYILWCLGNLPEGSEGYLKSITPKLARALGVTGPWHDMVATYMGFGETLPGHLRSLWEENRQDAERIGVAISPQDFAEAYVDRYFEIDKA